eukprot:2923680-Rhodomonas_salina.3
MLTISEALAGSSYNSGQERRDEYVTRNTNSPRTKIGKARTDWFASEACVWPEDGGLLCVCRLFVCGGVKKSSCSTRVQASAVTALGLVHTVPALTLPLRLVVLIAKLQSTFGFRVTYGPGRRGFDNKRSIVAYRVPIGRPRNPTKKLHLYPVFFGTFEKSLKAI